METDILQTEEEIYGPGADLMISLFAVSMLLLGIVGAGGQIDSVETQVRAREAADAALARNAGEMDRQRPPLKLASSDELLAAKTELVRQQQEAQRWRQAAEARETLLEEALKHRTTQPEYRSLHLLEFAFPVAGLVPFIKAPETMSITMSEDSLRTIREKAVPLSKGYNRVEVKTALPQAVLADLPAHMEGDELVRAVHILSTGLGEAYRAAIAKAGVPLACIGVEARSFDEALDIRKSALTDSLNAAETFSELAVLQRLSPPAAGDDGKAVIEIRLRHEPDSRCDPVILEQVFQSF